MNRNTKLLVGLACLSLGLTACKEDYFDQQLYDQMVKKAFPVENIDPTHTWAMFGTATVNVALNSPSGEKYRVAVYKEDPRENKKLTMLAQGTMESGSNKSLTFSYELAYPKAYVAIYAPDKRRTVREADLSDGGICNVNFFGTNEQASRSTRAVSVNGDSYPQFNFPTDAELAAAFPTSIPSNADEVSDLEALYVGTNLVDENGNEVINQWGGTITMWDIGAVYQYQITEGYNLKVTEPGQVTIGGNYQNFEWVNNGPVYHYYNVYVSVDGNLTINRLGAAHFNLYILKGNVTLPSNFGEMSGKISVAKGATLNDQRNSIAANGGVWLFNRGTVNATNSEKYDIGNNSTVYNEGEFIVNGPLSYSPGAGNTSYFINRFDDAVLTAPSMTLNSTCHFLTEGIVDISGVTSVTQQEIVWINNGHYTTGSMKFSAFNGTFYNYCQLIVENNCAFMDGQFNMMEGSYAEYGTAVFNNFHVDMHNNSGFNVKDGAAFGQQGAGITQGFYATDDNARVFVRLGGNTKIPAHKGGAFHVSGANLTLAYESMTFYEGCSLDLNSTYANANFWTETTAEKLAANQDERITWDKHNVENIITGTDFAAVTMAPKNNDCGFTWHDGSGYDYEEETTPQGFRFCFEDNFPTPGDYDFNDVVITVAPQIDGTTVKVKVILEAVGATKAIGAGMRLKGINLNWVTSMSCNANLDQGLPQTNTLMPTNGELSQNGVNILETAPEVGSDLALRLFSDAHWALSHEEEDIMNAVRRYMLNTIKNGNTELEERNKFTPVEATYTFEMDTEEHANLFVQQNFDVFIVEYHNSIPWEVHTVPFKLDQVIYQYANSAKLRPYAGETANYPWAICAPATFRYPIEWQSICGMGLADLTGNTYDDAEGPYKHFADWAANQNSYPNWYEVDVKTSLVY